MSENVDRMTEFLALYNGEERTWDDVKPTFEGFYHRDVVYEIGDGITVGFDQLIGFAKLAVEGRAVFEVEKVEETADGTLASGWMVREGRPKEFVQSVSKIEDGKFVHIKNADEGTDKVVQAVMQQTHEGAIMT